MRIQRKEVQPAQQACWRVGKRRLLLAFFCLALLAGVSLASIYYGMQLKQTGKASTLKEWAVSIKDHQLSFVGQYVRSLAVQPTTLHLDVSHKNWQYIAFTREEALAAGGLFFADEWVNANIHIDGTKHDVEIRLKGDREDHWRRDDVWSLKVKVKGDDTIFGMKRFALQHPETREFMNEWLLHKLLAHEDLLHLRYQFVGLSVNGEEKPIMALEENFEKRLVEYNRRREGLIFRFDTSAAWLKEPGVEASGLAGPQILPYGADDVVASPVSSQQLEVVTTLLERFRRGELQTSEVFDVPQLARVFALMELTGHHHATALDNMKFYYNPVTARIEPIAYDNAAIVPIHGLIGEGMQMENAAAAVPADWYDAVFADEAFFSAYVTALADLSDPAYIDQFFAGIEDEYSEQLAVLHKSYPWYHFDGKAILKKNQRYIADFLSPKRPAQPHLVSQEGDRVVVEIVNLHSFPLQVTGISYDGKRYPLYGGENGEIQGNQAGIVPKATERLSFRIPVAVNSEKELTLQYRVFGMDEDLDPLEVVQWKRESDLALHDIAPRESTMTAFSFLQIDDRSVRIPGGNWELVSDLVIPAGYTVNIDPGAQILLRNNANIISYSPIDANGTDAETIRIHADDGTGQGLIVLQANSESSLQHVVFEGLSNPSKRGWFVTGAITFYESPVSLQDVSFINNTSEDSLNIVRTEFSMEDMLFDGTLSDAFDADFASGTIANATFRSIGNDGIDVSGTTAVVSNVTIDVVGDKGISTGEDSRVIARNISIANATIAIASKDNSVLTIEDTDISETDMGAVAYQKKPEFGPGTIIADRITMENTLTPVIQEVGSVVEINGEQAADSQEAVYDFLYGDEE